MRTAVIIFLTGVCVWFLAPNFPTPSDVFQAQPPSEVTIETEPPQIKIPVLAITEPDFNLIERDVFKFINEEREAHDLHNLRWDENLHDMAREHSEWMAATGNFEHSNWNVFENCWWGIGICPENLASSCFDSWKNSKGHYENILEPSIYYGAIGFAESNQGTFATFIAE